MRIGFVFTNYNNSRLSIQAAKSIEENQGIHRCEIVIVDNASDADEVSILTALGAFTDNCRIILNDANVGYFQGLNIGIEYLTSGGCDFDLIVIGNNDLIFPPEFFNSLSNRSDLMSRYSVICPNLITLDNVNQNPHVLDTIGRIRELVWDLYYSNYYMAKIIGKLSRILKPLCERKDYLSHSHEGEIYSGYGACYILTPRFIEKYKKLWSPTFLMGEEFYLTRQLNDQGEKMYYAPEMVVKHHDHATLSKIPSRKLWEISRDSHKIYRYFINPYKRKMDEGKTISDYCNSISS